jgi:hypothetical protein
VQSALLFKLQPQHLELLVAFLYKDNVWPPEKINEIEPQGQELRFPDCAGSPRKILDSDGKGL